MNSSSQRRPTSYSYLAAEMIVRIQFEGAAMAKHHVANNQETNRYEVNADVSKQAPHERYTRTTLIEKF